MIAALVAAARRPVRRCPDGCGELVRQSPRYRGFWVHIAADGALIDDPHEWSTVSGPTGGAA